MKEDILNSYEKASKEYGYNSNSLHSLGLDARKIEEAASAQILSTLGLDDYEVIYTSGNAESFTTIINNAKGPIHSNSKKFISIAKEMGTEVLDTKKEVNHIDIDLNNSYEDLNSYDYITIEDDIPFFGVLIKRKNNELKNLIHGGKSTTKYRSGTSATPLIVSFSKLVRLKYKGK